MQTKEIEEFNGNIYPEGQIYNTQGGYTSKLIQRLYGCGFKAGVSGCVHTLYDTNNHIVCTAYSWVSLLMTTAKVLN